MTRSEGGPRARGREARHRRILDAAEELFAAHGFIKTSVEEIARRAGVSKGLVYTHYVSKEELLRDVWSRQVDAWMEATHKDVQAEGGSVAEGVARVLAVSVQHAREKPMLRRILSQDPGRLVPHEREDVGAFARRYREVLEPVLAHGVEAGELRSDLDVPHTAELVWLIHFGLIRELFVGPADGWRADGEHLVRATVAFVVAGLRA